MVLRSLVLLDDAEGGHRPPFFNVPGMGICSQAILVSCLAMRLEAFPQT